MNIAIDGPAGAGKSTIAKRLAKELGFIYLDTGAMYRATALAAYRAGKDISSEKEIEPLLETLDLAIRYENGTQHIYLQGEDVSEKIRENEVSMRASAISALKCVRLKMVDMQRKLAKDADVILDGRDIGTFVLPDAAFKFYLTAKASVRAKRRYDELTKKGRDCDLSKLEEEITKRDTADMNRTFAPLKKADDAIEVDTSDMNIEQVVEQLLKTIRTN